MLGQLFRTCFVSMKINTEALLQNLEAITCENLEELKMLESCSGPQLQQRERDSSWNALECLEHLNRYSEFYLPAFEKSMSRPSGDPEAEFRSGWLGNYFAEMMKPGPSMKTMKTFASKNPFNQGVKSEVIDRFRVQQEQTLELLKMARRHNLNRARVATTLGPLVRFKLGDALAFVIYHNQRHMVQALKAAGVAVEV